MGVRGLQEADDVHSSSLFAVRGNVKLLKRPLVLSLLSAIGLLVKVALILTNFKTLPVFVVVLLSTPNHLTQT